MKKKKRKCKTPVERKPDSPTIKHRKDLARLRKLEAIILTLQTTSFPNVSITALRSIESLCDTPEKMQRFALQLAEKTFVMVKTTVTPDELALMERSILAMQATINGTSGESIHAIHSACYRYQNEIQRMINGYSVRIMKCHELLLMEIALESFLDPDNPKHGYAVARHYVERYDSCNGTGIIPESIPALNDVIAFWERELQSAVPQSVAE